MLLSSVFWMCVAGLVYLFAGIFLVRTQIRAAQGWDRLICLGCVFVAVSLAVFAPEHFGPRQVAGAMVPPWIPVRWFWAYLVGCSLLAAATSLTLRFWLPWSSTLLALMFTLFVCMIHVESVLAQPKNRFVWVVLLRDLSFAGGAWALAGLHLRNWLPHATRWMVAFGRIIIGVAAIFFAIEHFLHPYFAPGVPLEKMTPLWMPLPAVWAYVAGVILLAAGFALILDKRARTAAAWIGALMTALTLIVYCPGLLFAHGPAAGELIEPLNYVADTLLYAGTALVLASALPRELTP